MCLDHGIVGSIQKLQRHLQFAFRGHYQNLFDAAEKRWSAADPLSAVRNLPA